jgi:uncharacterized membrane protein YfcA
MGSYLLLAISAFAAGIINSVAGGGSFFTFPALVFTGVPSIIANASSTMALLPGIFASAWAYRHDFKKTEGFPFVPMLIISFIGGLAGALLLLYTPQRAFDGMLPWLMLGATLLFTFGLRLAPILARVLHIGPAALLCIQAVVSIYGGYFGGAIGILMLAAWSLFGLKDIHRMNANRTLLGGAMNSVAVILFIVARKIWWPQTLVMLVAAVIGGYVGARFARRANPQYLRAAVMVISAAITIAFFLRHR